MAVKKVILNNNTIMTVEDTTAVEEDVAQGKIFYKSNGVRAIGTNNGSVSPSVINGFTVDNNNTLTYETSYLINTSPYDGTSYQISSAVMGTNVVSIRNQCMTVSSQSKSYKVALSYYENNAFIGQTWVNPTITTKSYVIQLPVSEMGGPPIYQVFYATPTIIVLDKNGNTLTNEQIQQNYSAKEFSFTSFDSTFYKDDEAAQFIIDNNIYYANEEQRQSIINSILQQLPKTETLTFTEISQEGTEVDPFTADEAYQYMVNTYGQPPHTTSEIFYVRDIVNSVALDEWGKEYIITLGSTGKGMFYYWDNSSLPEVNSIITVYGNLGYVNDVPNSVVIMNPTILNNGEYEEPKEPEVEEPKEPEPECEHSYITIKSIPATCTENGSEEWECTKCNNQIIQTIPALGHNYGEWVVTKEATSENDGSKEHTCSRCGNVETEIIPMIKE